MGLNSYTPTSVIAHTTSVDFSKRNISQPVHIVQYDKKLPILAVNIYNNGQLYPIPSDATVSIRFGKPDKTFVYNEALGCDSTRTIVYFEITEQMTIYDGEFYPVIEILRDNKTANSSKIYIIVDRNPIQIGDIESTTEFKNLTEYRDEAKNAVEEAKKVVAGVSEIKDKAETAAKNASASETNAKASADSSAKSANNAKDFADNASSSATKAAQSETNAKTSEENASAKAVEASSSATKAAQSETNAKTSEENALNSANEAARLEQSVINHENAVSQLANDAEASAKKSESWAVGGTSTRDGEDANNSKWYAEQAKNYAKEAEAIAGGNFIPTSDKGIAGGVAELDENLAVAKAVGDEDGNNIKNTYAKKDEIPDAVKVDGKTITKDENGVLHSTTNIEIDSVLNNESENPIMNKVVAKALNEVVKVDGETITKDENGILHGSANITVDPTLNKDSENPIMNKAVFEALTDTEQVLKSIAHDAVEKAESTSFGLTEIKMLGWSVPCECPIQNEINENQFIQKVGRIDLGEMDWTYYTESGYEGLRCKSPGNLKAVSNNSSVANIYTSVYETSTADNAYNHTKDKIISVNTSNYISVYDSSYTDASTFKTAMKGQYLYYELSNYITKNINGNEIGEIVKDVRKETTINSFKPTLQTTIQNGVTCTNNGDGTYTLTGTASDLTIFQLGDDSNLIIGQKYKALSIPTIGSDDKIRAVWDNHDYIYTTEGIVDTKTEEVRAMSIVVLSEYTCNNLVFKPMLTTNLSATYDDFVPYTGDTGSLNGDVANVKKEVDVLNNDVIDINKNVDSLKKSVSDGKTSVANAITAKGVSTATDAEFSTMATNISQIKTGGNVKIDGSEVISDLNLKTTYGNVPLDDVPYDIRGGIGIVYHNKLHILGGDKKQTQHLVYNGSIWSTNLNGLPLPCNTDRILGSAVVFDDCIYLLNGGDRPKIYKYSDKFHWQEVMSIPYIGHINSITAVLHNNVINFFCVNNASGSNKYKYYTYGYSESSHRDSITEKTPSSFLTTNNIALEYNDNIHLVVDGKLVRINDDNTISWIITKGCSYVYHAWVLNNTLQICDAYGIIYSYVDNEWKKEFIYLFVINASSSSVVTSQDIFVVYNNNLHCISYNKSFDTCINILINKQIYLP